MTDLYDNRLKQAKILVRSLGVSKNSKCKKPISKRNAELILQYENIRGLNSIKVQTRGSEVNRLLNLARILSKDFDKATKEDIKLLVGKLGERYKLWTQAKFRLTFKRFYKWLKQGDDYLMIDEYPEEVRWIRKGIRKNTEPRVQRSDCWTEEEIKRLIAVAEKPRDRALISLLTETGARVGEIGGLRLADVYQDEFGFLIHLNGKTGEREDRVIYSGPVLAEWLNTHPLRHNQNAPLFVQGRDGKALAYQGICTVLKKLAKLAGFEHKKCNPHIFRHSRATLMAEQGWPEPIIKEYLGWEKDSKMLSTYSHIGSKQANRYMLVKHGIKPKDDQSPQLKTQLCATCHKENEPQAKFCQRCGRPLSHEAILKYNHKKREAYDALNQIADEPEFKEVISRLLAKHAQSA